MLRRLGHADCERRLTVRFAPGEIVRAHWRDGLPKEPNRRRPAVVVEDGGLFDDAYPNAILVPLADDPHPAIEELSLEIVPTAENGCSKPCRAPAHNVTATSKRRCRATVSRITDGQSTALRRLIGEAIGF